VLVLFVGIDVSMPLTAYELETLVFAPAPGTATASPSMSAAQSAATTWLFDMFTSLVRACLCAAATREV
jgi:hypothetical protein